MHFYDTFPITTRPQDIQHTLNQSYLKEAHQALSGNIRFQHKGPFFIHPKDARVYLENSPYDNEAVIYEQLNDPNRLPEALAYQLYRYHQLKEAPQKQQALYVELYPKLKPYLTKHWMIKTHL